MHSLKKKLKYELDALKSVNNNEFPDIVLSRDLPGFPGLTDKLLSMLRKPWPDGKNYWKNRFKGACQSLFFITRPNMVTEFINLTRAVASEFDYPISELGCYIQPIEHNRACHLEFNFFYDGNDDFEKNRVAVLYTEAARSLLQEGAVFSRPYGTIAPLVYEKAAGYTQTLKRVKKIFDPNNIMNPGNLCF